MINWERQNVWDSCMILQDSKWVTLSLILIEMRAMRCLNDHMILRSSRIYSVTEYLTVQLNDKLYENDEMF